MSLLFTGNYGNKLDTSAPSQASTTPPTNPAYDGNSYYYLPWMNQKPCVVVESQWEDNTYRIESQNLLLFIVEELVRLKRCGCGHQLIFVISFSGSCFRKGQKNNATRKIRSQRMSRYIDRSHSGSCRAHQVRILLGYC